ncbi:hypothetical protein BANRA_05215 [Klebsiella pneumoniae]|nr:hypothetical protein BANRA_05215 [Klebsiella pneumoniae]
MIFIFYATYLKYKALPMKINSSFKNIDSDEKKVFYYIRC